MQIQLWEKTYHRVMCRNLYHSSNLSISLVILLFSEKLCSSCCKVNLPIVYKTGVDINDFSHIIDLQTGQDYGKNEDEEINATETEAKTHQLESIASSVCETNSETISNNEAAN